MHNILDSSHLFFISIWKFKYETEDTAWLLEGVNLECLLYPRGHISSHVQSVAMIIIQFGEGAGKYEINEQMS